MSNSQNCFFVFARRWVLTSSVSVTIWQKAVKHGLVCRELFQKCFSTEPKWMWGWFSCYVLHLPTQVYIPPIEHEGQLSQALQLICVTFPGRQNHSMLVNHYHTQLIILGAYMRISRCPSPPFFSLLLLPSLFPHATGLTSHPCWHPLAAWRQSLLFMC